MCLAILEVKYRTASSGTELIKVADEAALTSRLAILQGNEQVERITIFSPTRTFRRTVAWNESLHPPT